MKMSGSVMRYKRVLGMCLVLCTMLVLSVLPVIALADAIEGRTVVTLGEDLTQEEQEQLLREMRVDDHAEIIYVNNGEEHQYLGPYIEEERIGTRAISSVRVTLDTEGSGINVETNNISWVSEEMYTNALVTAGVTDADVYVTAPFAVSGTAALTGIVKAFEAATDQEISEEQKQAASEEMVRTAELAEKIGAEEATELLIRLKEALGDTPLETDEDFRNLILRIAAELNIELNEEDIQALTHLLKRLKNLDIDWDQVGNQLQHIRDNLEEFLNREETKNLIRTILDFLIGLIERIKGLFEA